MPSVKKMSALFSLRFTKGNTAMDFASALGRREGSGIWGFGSGVAACAPTGGSSGLRDTSTAIPIPTMTATSAPTVQPGTPPFFVGASPVAAPDETALLLGGDDC